MASAMLIIISFLMASLLVPGAQSSVGVCYGRDANNLPPPSEVVALYRQFNIQKMRIYDPNPEVLNALRGSNIELMLGIPNRDLENLANNPSAAYGWVQDNVRNYFPAVNIKIIVVGTEVNKEQRYAEKAVPAMTNVYNAVRDAGLLGQIQVTTSIDTSVMGVNYPPSAGAFRPEVMGLMNPVIGFLTDTRNPLLVSVYPYFFYAGGSNSMKYSYGPFINQSAAGPSLSYGLFTNQSPEFTDSGNGLQYQNLFDAELDGVYSALEKTNGGSLKVTTGETGWATRGRRPTASIDTSFSAVSIENARIYNQNLIRHVRGGTPKRRGQPIETYIFSMFNENMKGGNEDEGNFGLFYPNKQPVYPIDFSA